ncbi:MAG: SpvB/TcaC N-terminal domain-containing protein [Ginsengibacter sp.]
MPPPFNQNQSGSNTISEGNNSTFINNSQNDAARSKSNLVQIPSITLPKGGGAIKSIDEKFSVNAVNGTAAYTIPLPFSPGRAGSTPALDLHYNSGRGNSIFGLGWSVEYPCIQRKTEKKLPEYRDEKESDTFIFSGVEDLVPALIEDAPGKWIKDPKIPKGTTRYRPRIEGGFARIEKINDAGNVYWKVRSKDNVVSVFGKSDEAKLFSPVPGESYKIFRWCLEYSYDDKGNFILYNYRKENLDNVNPGIFEKNRSNGIALFTNIYLKSIKYSNTTAFYEGDLLPNDFLFEQVFDYGEHDAVKPTTKLTNQWISRKDPFSDYRSGFEIRTYRLCRRILMFHHFAELNQPGYLVRSTDLNYDEQKHLTYLASVTQTGYIWKDNGSLQSKRSLPPVEFSYFKPGFSREVKEISSEDLIHDPVGLASELYQWTDFYSEGISGILSEQASGWFYIQNEGNGKFSPAKLISPKPSFTGLADGSLAIQELAADSKKYFVHTNTSPKGYFELTTEEEWKSFRAFDSYPNIDLQDPNLRYLDLNGDGMPDILISQEQEFMWYASKGTAGYDDPIISAKASDNEKGPSIIFADKDEKILVAIADMSGDGLADIVLVTYASVCYYPNLGFGKFGAKVTLQISGCFDTITGFNPHFINFADMDGSGTTDIIYSAKDKIEVWFNQAGNSLSEPSEIFYPFPQMDDQVKLSFIDLLGNGTTCMAWSSSLPEHRAAPFRYIDIMEGRKPHVLFFYKNNMGREVTLEYKSATQYYLDDKKRGHKWLTKLPFPVQCVSKVITEDKVSRTRFANEYSYRHGFYDPVEREFRGFALVIQKDSETYENFVKQTVSTVTQTIEKDFFQPVVTTKSWFHTGAHINRDKLFHQFQEEYYPDALIREGQITDTALISTLNKYRLTEPPQPDNLTATESIECFRALKGLPLRQEIYSDEGDEPLRMHPYSVTQSSYEVRLLQPGADQQYAVFLSHETENLVIHYEREPADPRIAHSINIEIDPFGNVPESASIVYGRMQEDVSLPTISDRQQQTIQHAIYTQNGFTQTIDTATAFHLPVPCESQAWELKATPPSNTFYTAKEIKDFFNTATVKKYEEEASVKEKRLIEHSKILFFKKDLKNPMPQGTIDLPLLPYENYLLAFTPSLITDIFKTKTGDTFLKNKARYVELDADSNYWIKSGKIYYHADLSGNPFANSIPPATPAGVAFAKNNFYLPVVYEDNFGNLTKIFYDKHKLFIQRGVDAAKNESVVEAFNYRIPAPYLMRDANDNRAGIRFDETGLVVLTFVMGKQGEFKGDLIDATSIEMSVKDHPTTKLEYEYRYLLTNGKLPNRVKTSVREKHHHNPKAPETGNIPTWLTTVTDTINTNDPGTATNIIWQDSYSYSDGAGHEVLRKIQAEPGKAHPRDAQGKLLRSPTGELLIPVDTAPALRWVGNGRTIVNNKGNPVKQYQPYFDTTPEYNTESELTELGFTPLIHYDALGRVIKTENPAGTFSKVEFDSWMQKSWDDNDTVLESDWYKDRILAPVPGLATTEEIAAATNSTLHANTPSIIYLDSLGRPFLTVAHNKSQRSSETAEENFYYTRTEYDVEGNARSLTDAKGHTVMSWKYNMLGTICYQYSMDAGDRWMLADVMGKPLCLWDSRKQLFSYDYDVLHRPLRHLVNSGSGDTIFEKFEYGEEITHAKALNVRGKLYKHFDTAGMATNEVFDYKGNLLRSTRKLLKDYKNQPNWKTSLPLESELFAAETNYDALNRPVQMIAPDKSIILPTYNEANFLNSVDVRLKGSNTVTNFVNNINYNENGQRESILYGNNTLTTYRYQEENLRLTRLRTTANSGTSVLQDMRYTYDPVGNITSQLDDAQKTVFYGGQKINARSNYLYDALYRLIEAEGREHTGQAGINIQDNWNDNWNKLTLQPNAPVQLRGYTQKYSYDGVGNIITMQHITGGTSGWTRNYFYGNPNNQLTKTTVGSQNYSYSYNEHGSMKTMPHMLQQIDWNGREEMQHLHLGGGGEAWYVYDSGGQRVRKVIERPGNTTEERIYIGGFEIYRERSGNTIILERDTLHIMDDKQRIAMVETKTGEAPLIRYQYGNHLGSAALELDEQAKIISYEEYHPYGTTAYQATDASRQVPKKRYRYIGMERDEESGLSYHHARYYVTWLGRWLSCDPAGIVDGINIYLYVAQNPIGSIDRTGNVRVKLTAGVIPPEVVSEIFAARKFWSDKASLAWSKGEYLDAAGDTAVTAATGLAGLTTGILVRRPATPEDFLFEGVPLGTVTHVTEGVAKQAAISTIEGEAAKRVLTTEGQLASKAVAAEVKAVPATKALFVAEGESVATAPKVNRTGTAAAQDLHPNTPPKQPPKPAAWAQPGQTPAQKNAASAAAKKEYQAAGKSPRVIKGKPPKHHIASDKALKSGWTKKFEELFEKADIKKLLQDDANLVSIEGHERAHGHDYNKFIYDKLSKAVEKETAHTQGYKDALLGELSRLKSELARPGSTLNRWVAR